MERILEDAVFTQVLLTSTGAIIEVANNQNTNTMTNYTYLYKSRRKKKCLFYLIRHV